MPFLQTIRQSAMGFIYPAEPALAKAHVPVARWEWGAVTMLGLLSLTFGLPNLSGPSLWHDELVHVFVAKSIAATGWPALPSGNFYPSSTAYNYLLALFVRFLGDDAFSVRLPSVLLGSLNTALFYFLCRTLLGRNVALWAAFFFATSPWQIGWARQARLYEFQVSSYLLLLICAWHYLVHPEYKVARRFGVVAILAYLAGILTSFHSILYLGAPGAFAFWALTQKYPHKSRYLTLIATASILGLATIVFFYLNPNPVDRAAVFETGIGGRLLDQLRTDRYYYFRFLSGNLSQGFFLLAILGSALMLVRRDPKSFWVLLAFWVPVLILTYLVGYRRHRFMFFAYPLYFALYAYALAWCLAVLKSYRRSLFHGMIAVVLVLFLGRLAFSEVQLLRDSMHAASGAHTTLATRHPQWKAPLAWVKTHRRDEAILTTTYLPVLYYLGAADNWFPNRYTRWEYQESGIEGLGSLDELKVFLEAHPRGFYIAESSRFTMWRHHGSLNNLGQEVEWVEAHMTFLKEASSDDVLVWRWDFTSNGKAQVP